MFTCNNIVNIFIVRAGHKIGLALFLYINEVLQKERSFTAKWAVRLLELIKKKEKVEIKYLLFLADRQNKRKIYISVGMSILSGLISFVPDVVSGIVVSITVQIFLFTVNVPMTLLLIVPIILNFC